MPRDRKPIPKNQAEIVQDTIVPFLNQGKPVSQNVFTHRDNRALNTTRKTDKIKDITIGLEDIDSALMYYFKNIIISEEHNLSKPEEKIFRLAESFADAKTEECVMIGDNFESDILGALNAGWEAIYFAEEKPESYSGRHILNLTDLKNLF